MWPQPGLAPSTAARGRLSPAPPPLDVSCLCLKPQSVWTMRSFIKVLKLEDDSTNRIQAGRRLSLSDVVCVEPWAMARSLSEIHSAPSLLALAPAPGDPRSWSRDVLAGMCPWVQGSGMLWHPPRLQGCGCQEHQPGGWRCLGWEVAQVWDIPTLLLECWPGACC